MSKQRKNMTDATPDPPGAVACDSGPAAEPAAVAPAAVATASVAPGEADLRAEVDRLQAELSHATDRALRAHAELENFRKRTYRQMDEERKYAVLPLIRDLVPVVDNLERAIGAANGGAAGLLDGVKLVLQQLQSVLVGHHCQRIAAEGQTFDPQVHEAIAQHPSATHPAGTIVAVTQVGYLLHDRLVRPAQVLVSAGPPASATAAEPGNPSPEH